MAVIFAWTTIGMITSLGCTKERIVFWHPIKPQYYMDALVQAMNRFNQAHPEIKGVMEFPGGGERYQEKVLLSVNADTVPDVLRLSPAVKYPMQYSGKKIIVPMSELSENYKTELELEDVMPEVIEFTSYYGKLLGAPWMLQLEGSGLAYNKDLFKKAGLDPESPPESIEELVEYAKILTQDTDGDGTPDQWGYALPFGNKNWIIVPFAADLWRRGAEIYDEEHDKVLINGPEAVKALQFWVDCYYKYKICDLYAPDLSQMTHLYQYFGSGKVGMTMCSPDIGPYSFNFDWEVTHYPYVSAGLKVSAFNAQPLGVLEQCRHKRAAYEFIRWITSPEEGEYPKVMSGIGEFPVRYSTLTTPVWKQFVEKSPALKPFVEIVCDPQYIFRHRPRTPILSALKKIQKKAIQSAVYRKASAKEALDQAAQEYEYIIAKTKREGTWREPDWIDK